jgi:hypothetical protein
MNKTFLNLIFFISFISLSSFQVFKFVNIPKQLLVLCSLLRIYIVLCFRGID